MFYFEVILPSGVEFSVNVTRFLEHVRNQIRSLEGQQNTHNTLRKRTLSGNARKVEKEKKICEEGKVLTHTERTLVVRLFELL